MSRHTIHPLIRDRWSPRAFLPEALPTADLHGMLEAARWAPSCFNAQPWDFVVAERDTPAFDAVLGALAPQNQLWARNAGALIVSTAAGRFTHNDKPNRWAEYDTGAAAFALCLQAHADGYATHQMGGFDGEAIRTAVAMPETHAAIAVIAVGKQAPAATLPEALEERELAPRERRTEVTHHGTFGARLDEDPRITEVLDFWFGQRDEIGMSVDQGRWWKVDPAMDALIRERFEPLYQQAAQGVISDWERSARGRLALILVLDQFSRNMFRDTAAMYLHDPLAVALTHDGIALGLDLALDPQERVFFYMPLMHSEELEHQELGLAVFTALAEDAPEGARAGLRHNANYARQHLDIVERWGRFPHRNARLGRPSTEAELAFLETPGSSF